MNMGSALACTRSLRVGVSFGAGDPSEPRASQVPLAYRPLPSLAEEIPQAGWDGRGRFR